MGFMRAARTVVLILPQGGGIVQDKIFRVTGLLVGKVA